MEGTMEIYYKLKRHLGHAQLPGPPASPIPLLLLIHLTSLNTLSLSPLPLPLPLAAVTHLPCYFWPHLYPNSCPGTTPPHFAQTLPLFYPLPQPTPLSTPGLDFLLELSH